MKNKLQLVQISNSLLAKYCQELNYKTAQEVNNEELVIWLKNQQIENMANDE